MLAFIQPFDPADGDVRGRAEMGSRRAGSTATSLRDGRVLLAGGFTDNRPTVALADVFVPAGDRIPARGPMAQPRGAHAAARLADGRVLVVGGLSRGRVVASSELFDPRTGRFARGPAMRLPRYKAAAVTLLDGRVLVVGGSADIEGQPDLPQHGDLRAEAEPVRAGAAPASTPATRSGRGRRPARRRRARRGRCARYRSCGGARRPLRRRRRARSGAHACSRPRSCCASGEVLVTGGYDLGDQPDRAGLALPLSRDPRTLTNSPWPPYSRGRYSAREGFSCFSPSGTRVRLGSLGLARASRRDHRQRRRLLQDPADFYPALEELGVHLLRVHLNWGGKLGVATRRPPEAPTPRTRAYDWHLYDRVVRAAGPSRRRAHVHRLRHSGLGERRRRADAAPKNAPTAAQFAYAAATRYSGTYVRADGSRPPARPLLDGVERANLQIGLIPQWRRVGRRWVIQSARDYARICNAVVDGIRTTMLRGERSPAASPPRAATTTRRARSRPSRRSRSCAR